MKEKRPRKLDKLKGRINQRRFVQYVSASSDFPPTQDLGNLYEVLYRTFCERYEDIKYSSPLIKSTI